MTLKIEHDLACRMFKLMTISPAQCRAARGLIELDQAHLADMANVSRNVIVDFETGRRTPNPNNLAAIQRALESAGVAFMDAGSTLEGGAGVRLRGGLRSETIALDDLNASNDE
jgi:DNA-binding transcriptional regulator YiaG